MSKKSVGPIAQGDVLFVPMELLGEKIPSSAQEMNKEEGGFIIAHSETGHHHVAVGDLIAFSEPSDPLTGYLRVDGEAEIIHHRNFDAHAPISLPKGNWKVLRQQEFSPEGWRRVED